MVVSPMLRGLFGLSTNAETNTVTLDLAPGKHTVIVEYYQHGGGAVAQFGFSADTDVSLFQHSAEVTAMARKADAVVVAVGYGQSANTNSTRTGFHPFWPPQWARKGGLVESEDSDRPFDLPAAQLETIRLAIAANPRTIVVVNAGLKSESFIPIEEFKNDKGEVEVKAGDFVTVAIESLEDGYGETRLSRDKAKRLKAWHDLEAATGLVLH